MFISIFNLFSVGIGPSSSHTVGPMKAAAQFVAELTQNEVLTQTTRMTVELFGSLAFTGKGHGTDKAILLGLMGELPDRVDPDRIEPTALEISATQTLKLANQHAISFKVNEHFIFNFKDLLPKHTNGMRFRAYDAEDTLLNEAIFYSIGGGFILRDGSPAESLSAVDVPYPFDTASELLEHCRKSGLAIHEIMLKNEAVIQSEDTIREKLLHIASVMKECIEKGCRTPGILPGGLEVKRRAPELYQKLSEKGKPASHELTDSIAWLNLYAIAVNEENASGGRVVTAPTNGASGIIPAVLHYYMNFYNEACEEDIINFLLTAGAMAILYKKGASISGAEVGCQGEVGVASSMAAAALTAVLGGTIYQIENAAEIAMEHHLGLTCDPIKGLVQIPCIERNAMGSVKAVNAAQLALLGDGTHHVSLDKAIHTMKKTGEDMNSIYKETSIGGLAANLPEC